MLWILYETRTRLAPVNVLQSSRDAIGSNGSSTLSSSALRWGAQSGA